MALFSLSVEYNTTGVAFGQMRYARLWSQATCRRSREKQDFAGFGCECVSRSYYFQGVQSAGKLVLSLLSVLKRPFANRMY